MKVVESVAELIGGTPLIHMKGFETNGVTMLAKCEGMNPAGSAKDRVALEMIEDAERKGRLKKGSVIIEPTSGNTGIGIASVARAKGYRVILTMPATMSKERMMLLRAYGAELVLTEGSKGMQGSVEKAEELEKEVQNSIILGQFTNKANAQAHYKTTGPEIWRDTDGAVDIFVGGIGTGGTITGTGKYLKEQKASVQIVGVEPADSPLITKGVSGPHKLQGIGANFIPDVLEQDVLDGVATVTTEGAYEMARKFVQEMGMLVGISAGAAIKAAVEEAEKAENKGKTIVVLLPDSGERYLSTDLYN